MGLVRMPKNFFPLPSFPRPRHLQTANLNLEPARVQMYSLHNTILLNHSVATIAPRARMGYVQEMNLIWHCQWTFAWEKGRRTERKGSSFHTTLAPSRLGVPSPNFLI